MSDVDLSWMNEVGADGLTWIQRQSGGAPDLSWMNVPGPDGLTWAQKNAQNSTPAPATPPSLSAEQQKAWYELTQLLSRFGLEGMNDRVKQYIIENGTEDGTRIRLWLMDQPEFKKRFPALETLSKAGRAITPEQYVQIEQQYIGVMRQAGLNPAFFDEDPSNSGVQFHKLIENEVLPEEFRSRIQDGFNRVANVNPLIRDAFKNYFGLEGDQALAAFFIDPEKATPALLKAANAAEMGAAAYAQDMKIDLNYATKLAEQGVSYEQAKQGMQRISQLSALFGAGVGEANVAASASGPASLTKELSGKQPKEFGIPENIPPGKVNVSDDSTKMDQSAQLGVDYIFGTNVQTQKELQLRLEQRKAESSGSTQQSVINKRGRTSLGTSSS